MDKKQKTKNKNKKTKRIIAHNMTNVCVLHVHKISSYIMRTRLALSHKSFRLHNDTGDGLRYYYTIGGAHPDILQLCMRTVTGRVTIS